MVLNRKAGSISEIYRLMWRRKARFLKALVHQVPDRSFLITMATTNFTDCHHYSKFYIKLIEWRFWLLCFSSFYQMYYSLLAQYFWGKYNLSLLNKISENVLANKVFNRRDIGFYANLRTLHFLDPRRICISYSRSLFRELFLFVYFILLTLLYL